MRDLVERQPAHVAQMIRRCPPFGLNFVWTLDEHDEGRPIKRFPSHEEMPALWDLARVWWHEPLVIVAKSRQVLVSWLFVSLHLMDAMLNRGRRVFFQSKKEADAIALVERARHIYDWFPAEIRPRVIPKAAGAVSGKPPRLRFVGRQSEIVAFPQGADQVRSYTFSSGFCDEAGFMDEFEGAYGAVKPTIDGGGRLTVVSSASPGFFQDLYEDRLGEL